LSSIIETGRSATSGPLASCCLYFFRGGLYNYLPLCGRGRRFLSYQGHSWPGGRTIGALRAERQILTSANGTSCSACHELCSHAFLFFVSAERALSTNASLFAIFARFLANAPPPHKSLHTCFVCATHVHSHFCLHHWLLCHMGLYRFEFEFDHTVFARSATPRIRYHHFHGHSGLCT